MSAVRAAEGLLRAAVCVIVGCTGALSRAGRISSSRLLLEQAASSVAKNDIAMMRSMIAIPDIRCAHNAGKLGRGFGDANLDHSLVSQWNLDADLINARFV